MKFASDPAGTTVWAASRACQTANISKDSFMAFFKKHRGTLVAINAENASSRDWLVLLEAATVVGNDRDRLRVALVTQERKLVKKRRLFRKTQHFLLVDGYDPRIHALYFCPQLYTKKDGALVALTGPEIGQLMAHALEGGAIEKPPWYEPSNGAPKEPVINSSPEMEFDSLVVDAPATRASKPTALHSVAAPDKHKTAT
jgi:hypothetical protein